MLSTARALVADGLVIGSVGNVSVRRGGCVRITPSAQRYTHMRRADLVTVDAEGRIVEGRRQPSRELPLHAAIYARRPDVQAIVHCHSPFAVAWSFGGEPLLPEVEEIAYYRIGPILTTAREPAGSATLAQAAATTLAASQAVLLRGHGTVAVGVSLDAAATTARVVEHQAHVAWLLRSPIPHAPWTTPRSSQILET